MSTSRESLRRSMSGKSQGQSPMSPRLKPPKTTIPQSKIDRVTSSFLTLANQKISALPPAAQAPTVLCMDLENNRLSSSALQKIGKKVSSLNLSHNPLLDAKLPVLAGLRSLTLDNCGLTSFKGIPAFPNLRFLSANNNKIENFMGVPIFPKLESLSLSGNAVEFSAKIAIAAVGSIFLHTYNGEELTEETMRSAFSLSPLVGFALRQGRVAKGMKRTEKELEAAQEFLTADLVKFLAAEKMEVQGPPKLNIMTFNGEASIMCPYDSNSVKWYRSTGGKGPEWEPIPDLDEIVGKNKNAKILPLTMMMRMHLIKCEFVLKGRTFCVYTDWPIGRETGDLNLPYPLDALIAGLPIEGSLVSLIPSERPGRIAWTRGDITLAEDVPSIKLSSDDIGEIVTCLIQPYCPYFPNISFATVFVETGEVEPQIPTVSGIEFPEIILEDEPIQFTKSIVPDREGESQVIMERAATPSGEWLLVCELDKASLVYTPCAGDVNHYLRICYQPVATNGEVGEPTYFYAESKVLPTIPQFKNAVIAGLPKTHYPMAVIADYSGGRMGQCAYTWYWSQNPIRSMNLKGLKIVAEDTIYFTPGEEHADGYLAVEMTPVRSDEVVGDTVVTALRDPIVADDPPEPMENLPEPGGKLIVGEVIKFASPVAIFLSDTNGFCGFTELKRGTSFKPRQKQIGKLVRIVTEKSDVILGEICPASPEITDVSLSYKKAEVGMVATLQITQKNLEPGKFEVLWIRCKTNKKKPNETLFDRVVAIDVSEYTFTEEDKEQQIKVRITPFGVDGKPLKYSESQLTPVIRAAVFDAPQILTEDPKGMFYEDGVAELVYKKQVTDVKWFVSDKKDKWLQREDFTDRTYPITVEDLGKYIRCEFKVGNSSLFAVSSSFVIAREPHIKLMDPYSKDADEARKKRMVMEGDVLSPWLLYTGGNAGEHIYSWETEGYKTVENEETKEIEEVLEHRTVSTDPCYTVQTADVGTILSFKVECVRSDKKKGNKVEHTYGHIIPKPPAVTNVTVAQNDQGEIEISGVYSGGKEGNSYYDWKATSPEGRIISLGKTAKKTFAPKPELTGYMISASYIPVRDDNVIGEAVVSSNSVEVKPLPVIESVEILCKNGQVAVGVAIRCKAVCGRNAKCEYQWYRYDGVDWKIIEKATELDYTPCDLDANCYLRCKATPVNAGGWKGKSLYAATPYPVEGNDNQFLLVCRMNKFFTGVTVSTNSESEVEWERDDGKNWVHVGTAESYLLTANDIGHKIRAAVEGYVTEPSPVIEMPPEITKHLKPMLRMKMLKFTAKAKLGKSVWDVTTDTNGITMKAKGNDKSAKWATVHCEAVPDTRDEILLWLDASTKFIIIPSFDKDPRLLKALGSSARDFIVAFISQLTKA